MFLHVPKTPIEIHHQSLHTPGIASIDFNHWTIESNLNRWRIDPKSKIIDFLPFEIDGKPIQIAL